MGCSSLVEHQTITPLTQVRFPGAARDFLPRVNFQCRISFGVRTPTCAIACINICAHVKDPVVHVRVRWIMAAQTPSTPQRLGSTTVAAETVTSFKYLDSLITDEGCKPEILSRMAQTTAALTRLKPVWNDSYSNIPLSSKIRLMRSLVTSIFL